MNIFDIINVPLGMLINVLYKFCDNYALTLLLFAIVVNVILLPLNIQQQKGQIRMAQMKPKEQAIRKKYAGRTDKVTQQKMQAEILEMYKQENYSPMGGCLPLLIQLPIIFALFNIVREPLTYILQFSKENITALKSIIAPILEKSESTLNQIDIVKYLGEHFEDAVTAFKDTPAITQASLESIKNINAGFDFLGQSLTSSPQETGLSILLLIPVINFVVTFVQTKLQRMLTKNTALYDPNANQSMKMMEIISPLLILYMAYSINAAVGLYWIFSSLVRMGVSIGCAKIYPIPAISEEEYKLAEEKYGQQKKKKKKKVVIEVDEDAEIPQEYKAISESLEEAENENLGKDNKKDDKDNEEDENKDNDK